MIDRQLSLLLSAIATLTREIIPFVNVLSNGVGNRNAGGFVHCSQKISEKQRVLNSWLKTRCVDRR